MTSEYNNTFFKIPSPLDSKAFIQNPCYKQGFHNYVNNEANSIGVKAFVSSIKINASYRSDMTEGT